MRQATTELVGRLYNEFGPFPEPIVDLGGAETQRQFGSLFPYQVWDRRTLPDVDKAIDARYMTANGHAEAESVGTFMTFDTLEHIFELTMVVHEIGQVVRKDGLLIVGVPWAFPYHDPSGDYWRFSHQALESLFAAKFRKIQSGYYDEIVHSETWGEIPLASYYIGIRR